MPLQLQMRVWCFQQRVDWYCGQRVDFIFGDDLLNPLDFCLPWEDEFSNQPEQLQQIIGHKWTALQQEFDEAWGAEYSEEEEGLEETKEPEEPEVSEGEPQERAVGRRSPTPIPLRRITEAEFHDLVQQGDFGALRALHMASGDTDLAVSVFGVDLDRSRLPADLQRHVFTEQEDHRIMTFEDTNQIADLIEAHSEELVVERWRSYYRSTVH